MVNMTKIKYRLIKDEISQIPELSVECVMDIIARITGVSEDANLSNAENVRKFNARQKEEFLATGKPTYSQRYYTDNREKISERRKIAYHQRKLTSKSEAVEQICV